MRKLVRQRLALSGVLSAGLAAYALVPRIYWPMSAVLSCLCLYEYVRMRRLKAKYSDETKEPPETP